MINDWWLITDDIDWWHWLIVLILILILIKTRIDNIFGQKLPISPHPSLRTQLYLLWPYLLTLQVIHQNKRSLSILGWVSANFSLIKQPHNQQRSLVQDLDYRNPSVGQQRHFLAKLLRHFSPLSPFPHIQYAVNNIQ